MFKQLSKLVEARFKEMKKGTIHSVNLERNTLWDVYIESFSEDERQHHTCNCCKSFIRQMGRAVTINPESRELQSIFDIEDLDGYEGLPEMYKSAARMMALVATGTSIKGLFWHDEAHAGMTENYSEKHSTIFNHFHAAIPVSIRNVNNSMVRKNSDYIATFGLLKRAVEEISMDAVDTVLELIAQKSLYRGSTHKKGLEGLKKVMLDLPPSNVEEFLHIKASELPVSVSRIKNTSLGTLLMDLSEGKDLEKAVKAYEKMVAPENYQRPTALVTPRMIEKAKETLTNLGFISALDRRRLNSRDLEAADALFVYRPESNVKDVFSELAGDAPVDIKTLSKVEPVGIDHFIKEILPTVKSMRLLFEDQHVPNLVTLTGPNGEEENSLMKWDNSFGWSYKGGVADSLKEKVAALGGRVDGVMRLSLAWNHGGKNQSLMDLHVFLPQWKGKVTESSNTYGNLERVGWNNRKHLKTKGVQDVDNVRPPGKSVPVENITFPRMDLLPDGNYEFKIHNWNQRTPNREGFRAEIEIDGQLFEYDYPKALKQKEWVHLATVTKKNGNLSIKHHQKTGTPSQAHWGLTTGTWRQVNALTLSPNHWTKPLGNKHWFFLLDGCVSDEETRPFYNEFLCEALRAERKVCEVLADKIKVMPADGAELSGLGFSETIRKEVFLEIEGAFKRTIKLQF